MPIRPEFRHFYRGPAWLATRARILARARNKCEQCKAPNRELVGRAENGMWRLLDTGAAWHRNNGNVTTFYPAIGREVRIVLTIAHLNHTPGDDRDENLKALCQWCHLNYDARKHKESRSTRKDAARPLLKEMAS
jgi:hypothetical protein